MSGLDARLIASFVFAIAFDVLLPVVLVLVARRRLGFAWKTVGIGALAFTLSQLLTRVPAVQAVQYLLRDVLKESTPLLSLWFVVLSLTAGLFEETARWIAFKYPLKAFRRWRDAVGFGLGHGGLESAVLVGGLAAIGLVNVVVLTRMDLSSLSLPPEQLEQIRAAKEQVAAMRWWEPLLGAYERVGAMALQVGMTVLVLQCFLRSQRRWYWAAVGFHSLANLLTVLVARSVGNVAAEGVLTVFALVAVGFTLRLREGDASDSGSPPGPEKEYC
ncbi:YhfC family intramembrane metalloprotease [Melittangium boletus]|uniref:YhfC family intramembrane metalloprotease n=1 Tax=Melittangium boletus DSM 14713 TaxID=1294270 RepID=A0A250I7E2_9BACT|nr:YhfC family glutamic-type intramembrane protease [Melittangium boletus]ATB27799.1 hypothetical protein MEBOL_001244 [Melittangium boletus DSM 14713]